MKILGSSASGFAIAVLVGSLAVALAGPAAAADQVSREQDIADLRLGQHILVDDGSCPAGEIKQVTGATLTPAGVTRVRKCVPRLGLKKR